MTASTPASPTAFISYSWDDEPHKTWVRTLAERLRGDGVEATIDQWAAVPGDQLPEFMERAIGTNDYVLIICTPRYQERSDGRQGGVGYEGDIITGELLQTRNHRKFIPVLRRGSWQEAAPSWLAGKYYVDLRDGDQAEVQYRDLLSTVLGTRPTAPPTVRRAPAANPLGLAPSASRAAEPPLPTEPVRIVGVMADEVTRPRNDGTRGSALYTIPFRLSRRVSSDWAQIFEAVWNLPPRFSSMHRPGIARVRSDRIVLDGTTVEEVEKYHRETLLLCVDETNKKVQALEAEKRRQAEKRQREEEEHRARIRDAADRLKFD